MAEQESKQGWEPELNDKLSLKQVIDEAFDYRGYITMVLSDGSEQVGFVFNRDGVATEPFLQILDERGENPTTIPYAQIRSVRFSGKDHAAGKSWEAWSMRRDAARAKIQQAKDGRSGD